MSATAEPIAMEEVEKKWVKPKEGAKFIDYSEVTMAGWRWKGTGPAYTKKGRAIRYWLPTLDRFLRENLRGGGAS